MNNTETAGGTRYSSGKVSHMWVPLLGLDDIDLLSSHYVGQKHLTSAPTSAREELIRGISNMVSKGPRSIDPVTGYKAMTVCAWACLMPGGEDTYNPYDFLDGLKEVARVTAHGAEKYAPHDWHVGQSYSVLVGSGSRHVLDSGMLQPGAWNVPDYESGLLSRAHAAWNFMCMLTFEEEGRRAKMDDLSEWVDVTTKKKAELELAAEKDNLMRQQRNAYLNKLRSLSGLGSMYQTLSQFQRGSSFGILW